MTFSSQDPHSCSSCVALLLAAPVLHAVSGLYVNISTSRRSDHMPCTLHPLHLPAQPARFRDNLEGLKFEGQDLHVLQQSFEGTYNLNLQIEGEGTEWDSLQCHMRIEPSQESPKIH